MLAHALKSQGGKHLGNFFFFFNRKKEWRLIKKFFILVWKRFQSTKTIKPLQGIRVLELGQVKLLVLNVKFL